MTTELQNLRFYRRYIEDNLDRIARDGWIPICFAEFQESEELTEYLATMTLRYKTKLLVEVLSEERPVTDLSLEEIAWAILNGDCVGRISIDAVVLLTSKEMVDNLKDFGSEPGFFQLDDDGESV